MNHIYVLDYNIKYYNIEMIILLMILLLNFNIYKVISYRQMILLIIFMLFFEIIINLKNL